MQEVIYTKYSNDRDPKFNIITDIIKDNANNKWVLKRPYNQEAGAHIDAFIRNSGILYNKYKDTNIKIIEADRTADGAKVSWAPGDAFSNYLDELLISDNYREWLDSVNEYFDNILIEKKNKFIKTEKFNRIFGDVELPEDLESVSDIDLDMLFSNVFYHNGKWILFDYEWTIDFDIPVKFLIYRCIHYYIETQIRQLYFDEKIYDTFGISEDLIKIFKEMETNFQRYVEGSSIPMWKIYDDIHGARAYIPLLYDQHLAKSQSEIFYDYGMGYRAGNSERVKIVENEEKKYNLDININPNVFSIRFDPCSYPCLLTNLSVTEGEKELNYLSNGEKLNKNDILFLNNDPQIIISGFNSNEIHISYELHYLDDGDVLPDSALKDYIAQKDIELNFREREHRLEIRKKDEALVEAHKSIHEYEDSTSWKITKPIRLIKDKLLKYKKTTAIKQPEIENDFYEDITDSIEDVEIYEDWIEDVEKDYKKIDADSLEYKPKISVLVPVYNVSDEHLEACINSVIAQDYPNWELCLVDDCSTWKNVEKTLKKYENHDKINVIYRKENGHISECTNTALENATGDYIALLDCDDTLAPFALSQVVWLLNQDKSLDFIYSDEDKIDEGGKERRNPHFKSDWAPDTFMSIMYTCHLAVFRRNIALEIGGFRKGYEGAQDYDFTLRFTEKTDKIGHIPKVLYHWRERKESTASNIDAKTYALEAAAKSKLDALERRGLKGNTEYVEGTLQYRVNYLPDKYPKVSVIIPSKDNYEYLERCLKSFALKTEYPDYEFIIVDNGSNKENKLKYEKLINKYNGKYIYEKQDFNFSHMCNLGAKNASGEVLLFLNDDIEIINSIWLKRMVGQALLEHTGAVGAKLLYPDGVTIQHIGVVSAENGPIHILGNLKDNIVQPYGRNKLDYNESAVTGACLMITRKKFDEVGGFDENLPIAYNDVDLCFKLIEEGLFNTVRTDAALIHHESISRGYDDINKEKYLRLQKERKSLYDRHPKFYQKDPFYNPNLTQVSNDFSYNFEMLAKEPQPLEKIGKPNFAEEIITGTIDEASLRESDIIIRGWAIKDGFDTKSRNNPYVLIGNDKDEWFKVNTHKIKRSDVDKSLNGHGKYNYAGFFTKIGRGKLSPGIYKIGIGLNNDSILTEYVLDVK